MHELSIARAVVDVATRHAGERPVEVVALRVGALRQVAPGSLSFYWDVVTRGTCCAGSRLALSESGVRLRCTRCRHAWEPAVPAFRCPECGSGEVQVTAGNELEIEYLEVVDA